MGNAREILMAVAAVGMFAGCDASSVQRHGPEPDSDDPGDEAPEDADEDHDEDDDEEDEAIGRPERDAGRLPSRDAGDPVLPTPPHLGEIIVADRAPPPISGGTLAVTPEGTLAVAADPDRDAVYIVDVEARSVRTVAFAAKSEPGRVALDSSGGAHVVLRNHGAVARIDRAAGKIVAETKVCQLPRGLAYDGAKDALWVACASGELVSLDAATHAERTRTFLALDLRDVVITGDGERFVSRYRSAELIHVGADGLLTSATPMPIQTTRFVPPPLEDGLQPAGALLGPVPAEGFVQVTMSPTLAWRTVVAADGQPVMLHQRAQDDEVVIAPGGYGGGCQTITNAGVTRYDPRGMPSETMTLGGPALTVDVAASPDGRLLAVATPGAYLTAQSSVQVLSATLLSSVEGQNAAPPALAPDPAASSATPPGSAEDAGKRRAPPDGGLPEPPACNFGAMLGLGTQATAVAFDAAGHLYVLNREPGRLDIYEELDTSGFNWQERATISLSEQSVRDTGHELFHADVGSGLACASCHGEALDDGHVWTFAEFGPRRTQNMRGGMLSTLPLHWEGDMPTFKHLVDEVMTRRMGGFPVEEKHAAALARWIDSQPAIRLEAADGAAVARGKQLFESTDAACATCHAGAMLTNNQTADVGTGGLFQVPSLLGLALRGPFMHDGCAATLAGRFDPACGGGDEHGRTSQLTPEQTADLVAYLQTL